MHQRFSFFAFANLAWRLSNDAAITMQLNSLAHANARIERKMKSTKKRAEKKPKTALRVMIAESRSIRRDIFNIFGNRRSKKGQKMRTNQECKQQKPRN